MTQDWKEKIDKVVEDHEKRIRWIERLIGYGLGAAGAAKFLFDWVK